MEITRLFLVGYTGRSGISNMEIGYIGNRRISNSSMYTNPPITVIQTSIHKITYLITWK